MEIIFQITKKRNSDLEKHSVIADGKIMMEVREGIEPEDVLFCRDLPSPFDCEELIKLVIDAVKKGEEVTIKCVEKTT